MNEPETDLQAETLRCALGERWQRPLPGWLVQSRFQHELAHGRYQGPAPRSARLAAVLALFYPRRGTWHLPLILRPGDVSEHAGQIAFPGGGVDRGEEPRAAALRELQEEVGVESSSARVVGPLTPLYLFRSGYLIHPWVAVMEDEPRWRLNPREVAQLLEIPFGELLDPGIVHRRRRISHGVVFSAPTFAWREHEIWGATSMILAELAEIGRDIGFPTPPSRS